MDLVCADKVKTNSMLSVHYIVYGIAGLLMYTMADRSGRKTAMIRVFGLHIAAQYLMIFVPTYSARLTAFMLYGLTAIKNTIPYVYLVELIPTRFIIRANASITAFDSGTVSFVCFYFIFVSKDWFPLVFTMTVLSTLSYLVICFTLPESPIWLLNQGRNQDAIDALNSIGRMNGVKRQIPKNAIFLESRQVINSPTEMTESKFTENSKENLLQD